MMSKKYRQVPNDLYEILNNIFNFNQDLSEESALNSRWSGNVFIYPQRYVEKWVIKAYDEALYNPDVGFVVMLLPVITNSNWFFNYGIMGDVFFIKNKLAIKDDFGNIVSKIRTPHMLIIFSKKIILGKIEDRFNNKLVDALGDYIITSKRL